MPSQGNDAAIVREFTAKDIAGIVACFSELQEFERQIEPRRLPGEKVAASYVQSLLKQCAGKEGTIFVAEKNEQIIGFACILSAVILDEDLNEPNRSSYLTDLIVMPAFRRGGVARALMRCAEEFARKRGASDVTLNMLLKNDSTQRFYKAMGYNDYELKLCKLL